MPESKVTKRLQLRIVRSRIFVYLHPYSGGPSEPGVGLHGSRVCTLSLPAPRSSLARSSTVGPWRRSCPRMI
eukprot:1875870-Prorocentrum_lima.AAC.2